MTPHKPKLDKSLAGNTRPGRHRLRRLLTTLTLITIVMMVFVTVAVGARVVWRKHATRQTLTPQPEVLEEVLVTEEQALQETESPEAPAPEPEPESEPVKADLTLMMIGDILMHDAVIESGNRGDGTYSFDHLFSHIAEDVQEADVAIPKQ